MKQGFSLLEVLLAVAILSVSFTVLLSGASQCLAVFYRVREYERAQWSFGLGEAEYPLVSTDDPEKMRVAATVLDTGHTFAREVDEEDPADEDGLRVVRTTVTWSVRGREAKEEIVRYVLMEKK